MTKVRTPKEARRAERGSWGPDDIEIIPPDDVESGVKPAKASPSR